MGKEAANRLKKYLKPDAVPSVFDFPPHLSNETNPRNSPKKRQATTTIKGVPCKRPKKVYQPVRHDHNYSVSPRKVIPKMKKALEDKRKKIKTLTKKSLRKVKTIKGLLKKLQDMKHLSKEQSANLMSNFGHMTKELFINEQKNIQKSKTARYSESIKKFAVSLHFYSPKAY